MSDLLEAPFSEIVTNVVLVASYSVSTMNKAVATASVACGWAGAVMWGGRGGGGCHIHESIGHMQLARGGDAKTARRVVA